MRKTLIHAWLYVEKLNQFRKTYDLVLEVTYGIKSRLWISCSQGIEFETVKPNFWLDWLQNHLRRLVMITSVYIWVAMEVWFWALCWAMFSDCPETSSFFPIDLSSWSSCLGVSQVLICETNYTCSNVSFDFEVFYTSHRSTKMLQVLEDDMTHIWIIH